MMRSRQSRAWLFSDALDLLQSADRLQKQFFQVNDQRGCWAPPIDVHESGDDLWIFVALPGVPQERTQVSIDGQTLIIHGERPLPHTAPGATIHRLEIPYGHFERTISLPAGRYQIIQRVVENGCLVLGLRRLDQERLTMRGDTSPRAPLNQGA